MTGCLLQKSTESGVGGKRGVGEEDLGPAAIIGNAMQVGYRLHDLIGVNSTIPGSVS